MTADAQSAHGRESGSRDEQHALGLTQAEADRRLATVGANAMPREVSHAGLRLLLRTLATVTLAFVGQATFYVVRDRERLWSSRPSAWIYVDH